MATSKYYKIVKGVMYVKKNNKYIRLLGLNSLDNDKYMLMWETNDGDTIEKYSDSLKEIKDIYKEKVKSRYIVYVGKNPKFDYIKELKAKAKEKAKKKVVKKSSYKRKTITNEEFKSMLKRGGTKIFK